MKYKVHVMASAEDDLFHLHKYVTDNDSRDTADKLIAKLEKLCASLGEVPERGHITPELKALNVDDYREIHYHEYRIIYRVMDHEVMIYAILHDRRNLQTLLHERLIR